MNPLILIPEPYRALATLLAIVVAVGALVGGVLYVKHQYDDGKRAEGAAPYIAAIAAQKQEAAKLLATETAKVRAAEADRDQRITNLVGVYSDERIKTERDFIAERAAHGRLRDTDARCGDGSNRAQGLKAEAASAVKGTGSGVEISARLEGLLWNLIRDTEATIGQYEFCRGYAREVSEP